MCMGGTRRQRDEDATRMRRRFKWRISCAAGSCTDTSVILTSATLSTSGAVESPSPSPAASPETPGEPASGPRTARERRVSANSFRPRSAGLDYVAHRVGAEAAELLQVGSPFDYERQMKLFVVGKMPDPREAGYTDALAHWIEHFIRRSHGKAFVLFTNSRLMLDMGERMSADLQGFGRNVLSRGRVCPGPLMLEKFKADVNSVLLARTVSGRGGCSGRALSMSSLPAVLRCD